MPGKDETLTTTILVTGASGVRQGNSDVVNDKLERLAGRPPTSLKQFLQENRSVLLPESDPGISP